MELREALAQISEIRQQVARTAVFPGYRAVPVAFSGLLALTVAVLEEAWISDPLQEIAAYLTLWVGAAVISLLAMGVEIALNYRASGSSLSRELTRLAVGQFLPSVVAGGLVTFALVTYARASVWLLPGLWAILFSLGIFASHRLLPRATFWVALFYLVVGTFCLTLGEASLSPWAMGVPFGVGQLFAAAVLYWTLERNDGEKQEQTD